VLHLALEFTHALRLSDKWNGKVDAVGNSIGIPLRAARAGCEHFPSGKIMTEERWAGAEVSEHAETSLARTRLVQAALVFRCRHAAGFFSLFPDLALSA
jgi:hypothetical protein